jgi:fructose-specific phosphotransferase system IIC component
MHFQDVVQYQRERLRNPWVRIPMAILGSAIVLGMLPMIAASPVRGNPGTWMILALAATTLPLLVLWLSPAPWLWTGGRASHTPLLRGVVQSALFNGALLLGILAVYTAIWSLDIWSRLRLAKDLELERKKAIAPEVADLNALQVFKGGFAQRSCVQIFL